MVACFASSAGLAGRRLGEGASNRDIPRTASGESRGYTENRSTQDGGYERQRSPGSGRTRGGERSSEHRERRGPRGIRERSPPPKSRFVQSPNPSMSLDSSPKHWTLAQALGLTPFVLALHMHSPEPNTLVPYRYYILIMTQVVGLIMTHTDSSSCSWRKATLSQLCLMSGGWCSVLGMGGWIGKRGPVSAAACFQYHTTIYTPCTKTTLIG